MKKTAEKKTETKKNETLSLYGKTPEDAIREFMSVRITTVSKDMKIKKDKTVKQQV